MNCLFTSLGGQPKDNPSFFCKLFLDLAHYFHATSSRKCRQLSSSKASFPLNEGEVTWLCLHAFKTSLQKKPRYGEILHFLTTGLSRIGYPSKDLRKATDSVQHAVIKEIRWNYIFNHQFRERTFHWFSLILCVLCTYFPWKVLKFINII